MILHGFAALNPVDHIFRSGGTILMPFDAIGFVNGKSSHAVRCLLQMA